MNDAHPTRILILSIFLCLCSSGFAATTLVWSIGKVDKSHKEFALFGHYEDYSKEFPQDVNFTVGSSVPAQAWPGVQPGPLDSWAEGKPHVFSIGFNLPKIQPGSYVLSLVLVNTHNIHSGALQIEINGDKRSLRLPTGSGDGALTDPARGQDFRLDLPLEGSLLNQGQNTLRMSTTESWVIWDSLSLHHLDAGLGAAVATDSFSFKVLPLFKRSQEKLVQPASFSMNLVRPAKNLKARLHIQGTTAEVDLGSKVLGRVEKRIDVPEIIRAGTARIELRDGDEAVFTRAFKVKPSRKWTIHVVPQAHVDVGYTDLQEKAMEVHRKSNDLAIKLVEKYPEFVWSVESSYVLEKWLKTRPPELIEQFFELAKSDRIEIGAIYGNLLTGLLSDEEAFRSLYFSKQISHEHGSAFRSATLTDAPSHIWSIPTVLSKSGVKYLSMGINQTRAPLLRQGLDKRSPVWWEGPDGSRILAFFHDHYAWAGRVGLTDAWPGQYAADAGMGKAEKQIPWLLSLYDRPDYPYNTIHLHGAYGDNRPLTEQLPRTVRQWNKKYAYPRIVFSSNTEWFEALEHEHGHQLKTISGDGGAFWEDGAASSAAQTAINRQSQQQALLAEMLLAGLHAEGRVSQDYRHEFRDIWHLVMLYDEHTWGAHNSVADPDLPEVKEQFRYKAQFAYDAQRRLKPLLQQARSLIKTSSEKPNKNWELEGSRLRTAHYDVTFDLERGGIKSVIDRETKRELVDQSAPYLCGQVVYAENGKPPYKFSTSTFKDIQVFEERVVLRLQHPMMPEINLVLRPGVTEKRLDLEYEIEKKITYDKEGIYIAFPFAGKKPQIDYAVANAVVRAGRDWLPGACKDWFTVQNWVRVRDGNSSVLWATLDAPLINLQDVNSNKWLDELPIVNGHVYAYIMNNYWFTNYKAGQGGHVHFRFALTSGETISNAAAVQFGRDWSPSERAAINGMISANPDNVVVSGFKRSEDGKGYVARLRETSGRATSASLKIPALKNSKKAYLANGVEDIEKELPLRNQAVTVDLKPWDVVTLKFE
jgi:hypothetical protein